MANPEINEQAALWNARHAKRNTDGPEGTLLKNIPTPTAIHLLSLLRPNSRILEVGSANGRDARTWARNGHAVDCIDFSTIALDQLLENVKEQGLSNLVIAHYYDISDGNLPDTLPVGVSYDAFYARSALTIEDDALELLARNVDRSLYPGGIILIEGRSPNDPKIRRSKITGNMANDNGHLRRVYTPENMTALAKSLGWNIEELSEHEEGGFESVLHMLRMVARRP